MSARSRLVSVVAAVTVAAAGCGSGGDDGATDAAPDIFDSSVVHEIQVDYDEADYDTMIATFVETREKEWIEATVNVDGVTYEQVGMRLKGNSSLGGLGGGFPGGPGGSVSADAPEGLPWLIRLDRFVDDQVHQDYEDIVIRSNPSETALNEAVALDLLEEAGLASQEAAATSFQVNDRDAVLRLTVENPDDDIWYEARFDADGALYKAESTGDWSYRGDDPAAYDEVFDQEGGSDITDLTPLIELLQFLNESDDATFAAELPQRLDVDAFAAYLAMMDLLANWDDIDGPGNNAYLWYDVTTQQFTIVPWDMNLSLGVGFGGGGGGGGFPGRSNPLVQRFHANADFEALYQQQRIELRASLYESGVADEILDTWVAMLTAQATDLVDTATIATEADVIRQQFTAECVTATNAEHVSAGRATVFLLWVWARGSNAYIGLTWDSTSLREAPAATWTRVTSC
jgi:spore coat protein CotH